MGRREYRRCDLLVELRAHTRATSALVAQVGDVRAEQRFRVSTVTEAPGPRVRLALERVLSPLRAAWVAAATSEGSDLPRVVISCEHTSFSSYDWEAACSQIMDGVPLRYAIVRTTPVPPRGARDIWALPLRLLFVHQVPKAPMKQLVLDIFGNLPPSDVGDAIAARDLGVEEFERWKPTQEWPTAEIVHLDGLPTLEERALISTADPERFGTLGWFARLAEMAQLRLLVIRCDTPMAMKRARALGNAVVSRGGPAVLLVHAADERRVEAFRSVYDELVHDRPLDWIAGTLASSGASYALFAGAGREEGLRVSGPALKLREAADAFEQPEVRLKVRDELSAMISKAIETSRGRPGGLPRSVARGVDNAMSSLESVGIQWQSFQFEQHESGGFIPYARSVRAARDEMFGTGRRPVMPPRVSREARAKESPHEQFLNANLLSEGANPQPLAQNRALMADRSCLLEVRIGALSANVLAFAMTPILQEQLNLRDGESGTWVDIGITGIGFRVIGDPVQELWLPRDGDSDAIRFAVVPWRKPVSMLRVCLYHRQNLLQSIRLAALTTASASDAMPRNGAAVLARALRMPRERIAGLGWAPRLEYTRLTEPNEAPAAAARVISIAANDSNGTPVITVKGAGVFNVELPGSMATRVRRLREALDEIGTPPVDGLSRENWPYAFRGGRQVNEGTDSLLSAALIRLAKAGWGLYTQVIGRGAREALEPLLREPDGVIQVAHILIEKVLPWALIYDREFAPDNSLDANGDPQPPVACLAALPKASGELTVRECGVHADCLLHHRSPEGVACPLRFWGFRHSVEIPPRQTSPGAANPSEADRITAGRPAVLLAALNTELSLATAHEADLTALSNRIGGTATWRAFEKQGQLVTQRLRDADLDIVYLYCHARGGEADPSIDDPCLEFVGANAKPQRIVAGDLSGPVWNNRPLVILNGCGSVGFSPDALSPFLPALVRDRHAAGLLGSEVSVWEQLAGKFAEYFLEAFLVRQANGLHRTAGEAVLIARRKLLALKNPLGLVYTLYANSDLRLSEK